MNEEGQCYNGPMHDTMTARGRVLRLLWPHDHNLPPLAVF